MIINNVELPDIDITDADVMANYESAHDKVAQAMDNLSATGKRASDIIKAECEAIFTFFNDVFGSGTDKKVFGDRVNLTICINAYAAVINAVKRLDQSQMAKLKATALSVTSKPKQSKHKQYNHYKNHLQSGKH